MLQRNTVLTKSEFLEQVKIDKSTLSRWMSDADFRELAWIELSERLQFVDVDGFCDWLRRRSEDRGRDRKPSKNPRLRRGDE